MEKSSIVYLTISNDIQYRAWVRVRYIPTNRLYAKLDNTHHSILKEWIISRKFPSDVLRNDLFGSSNRVKITSFPFTTPHMHLLMRILNGNKGWSPRGVNQMRFNQLEGCWIFTSGQFDPNTLWWRLKLVHGDVIVTMENNLGDWFLKIQESRLPIWTYLFCLQKLSLCAYWMKSLRKWHIIHIFSDNREIFDCRLQYYFSTSNCMLFLYDNWSRRIVNRDEQSHTFFV